MKEYCSSAYPIWVTKYYKYLVYNSSAGPPLWLCSSYCIQHQASLQILVIFCIYNWHGSLNTPLHDYRASNIGTVTTMPTPTKPRRLWQFSSYSLGWPSEDRLSRHPASHQSNKVCILCSLLYEVSYNAIVTPLLFENTAERWHNTNVIHYEEQQGRPGLEIGTAANMLLII